MSGSRKLDSRGATERPPGLVYLATHPMTVRLLLRGQLEWMQERGFAVTAITSTEPEPVSDTAEPPFGVRRIAMSREISPLTDPISLIRLVRELRRIRPAIVNASTPKAGLLGSLAARLAGVPVRVYTMRGLRLETTTGARRGLLTLVERLACRASQRVICVSESLRRRCGELALCDLARAVVLGHGSSNGVDAERFARRSTEQLDSLRQRLGLTGSEPVVGFVGRLTRDKGIESLRLAFEAVRGRLPNARLLLVGGSEPGDPLPSETLGWLADAASVLNVGTVADTAPYYSLMRVLAFPSLREGLPNAPLEAAAAGVPTVGCRVTGTVDAVEDGVGGLLVEPGDAPGLARGLLRYLEDETLASAHGAAARERAAQLFRPEDMWRALESEYHALLRRAGLPLPRST